MKKFSTNAFRSFKNFIGELTAVAAGIHVGMCRAISDVEKIGTADYWKSAAQDQGIIVNGLKSARVLDGSSRLNVVSLYSGFDLFVSDIRSQFYHIQGEEWQQHKGDTPFEEIARNTKSTKHDHEARLGLHRIAVLNYYRLVRNAIAHPTEEALKSAKDYYFSNTELLTLARTEYGMQTAPNPIENLSFHDVKFLARVALDLAAFIEADFDPGDERLAALVPSGIIKPAKSRERNVNALKGWLRTTFGVQPDRADRIIVKLDDNKKFKEIHIRAPVKVP